MFFLGRYSVALHFTLLLIVVVVQSERTSSLGSHSSSKTRMPSILNDEASQWLSTGQVPTRWRHHQRLHQGSNEIDQTLKRLQFVNDNGIRQHDTQAFEGVSMEVIFEMVYKQQNIS